MDEYGCPVDGCVVWPYDRQSDLDEHVAAGVHVFKVGRREWHQVGLTGRWVRDGASWVVEARAFVGDVVTVEKRDGSTVEARLVRGHGGKRFDAERVSP